jgi:hypothetical protein
MTDDRRQTPSDGKSSLCLWQGELKNDLAPDKVVLEEAEEEFGVNQYVSIR